MLSKLRKYLSSSLPLSRLADEAFSLPEKGCIPHSLRHMSVSDPWKSDISIGFPDFVWNSGWMENIQYRDSGWKTMRLDKGIQAFMRRDSVVLPFWGSGPWQYIHATQELKRESERTREAKPLSSLSVSWTVLFLLTLARANLSRSSFASHAPFPPNVFSVRIKLLSARLYFCLALA